MVICLKCKSNLVSERCDFCGLETPKEQAKYMRSEASSFLKRNAGRHTIHLGPRSKFSSMARTLSELGMLSLSRYERTSRMSSYMWTEYGREVLKVISA